jgi:HNH endonuclease
MSPVPERRVTADEVWRIVEAAKGRCVYCGSLCLEKLPYDLVTKKKLPWGHVGRRIGSLSHIIPRASGGTNDSANLVWSCLWCNTWTCERIAGAADHGGSAIAGPRPTTCTTQPR